MKKNICFLLTFIISLLVFTSTVFANNNDSKMAMWLDCDYEVYKDDVNKIEIGRHLVFIGGWKSAEDSAGYYRLLNPMIFKDHPPTLYTNIDSDNPFFDSDDPCWFKHEDDIGKSCLDNNVEKYSKDEANQMLRKGICPAIIRDGDGVYSNEIIVFAGIGDTNNAYYLTNQYRFFKNSANQNIEAYGYDLNGLFIRTSNGQVISSYNETQKNIFEKLINGAPLTGIEKYGNTFMNVAEHDYLAVVGAGIDSEVIFDSNNNINKLYEVVDDWYSETDIGKEAAEMEKIKSDYAKAINSCNSLNLSYDEGKRYSFSSDYSAAKMLSDLEGLYVDLNNFYSKSTNENQYKMCVSNSTTTDAAFSAYNCSMIELLGNIDYVPEQLQEFVLSDIKAYLTNVKGVYLEETGDDILNTALFCSANLYNSSSYYGLNSSDVSKVANKYSELGENRGIFVDFNCESLLGEDLINKINSYLDIFKIAVPIILIAFAVIDFTKAIFQGDDEMKKAQNNFIKRIFIAILIFFTPIVVNLILTIANVVWSNISPNNCGLF